MKYLLRPLTKRMIEQLISVRQMELSESPGEIALSHHFKNSLGGLFRRGFIDTKMVKHGDKQLMRIYLTESGIIFLKNYNCHNENFD